MYFLSGFATFVGGKGGTSGLSSDLRELVMRPRRLLGFTDAAPLTVLALSDSSFSRSVARSR